MRWKMAPWKGHKGLFEPRYERDCESCVFQRRFDLIFKDDELDDAEERLMAFDLWLCPTGDLTGSVILRHGSEGSEYYSVPTNMLLQCAIDLGSPDESKWWPVLKWLVDQRLVESHFTKKVSEETQ